MSVGIIEGTPLLSSLLRLLDFACTLLTHQSFFRMLACLEQKEPMWASSPQKWKSVTLPCAKLTEFNCRCHILSSCCFLLLCSSFHHTFDLPFVVGQGISCSLSCPRENWATNIVDQRSTTNVSHPFFKCPFLHLFIAFFLSALFSFMCFLALITNRPLHHCKASL